MGALLLLNFIPNITDIILTSIGFSKDNLAYFILRYITQFFTFILVYISFFFISETGKDEIGELLYLGPFGIAVIIFLLFDIIGLVFFVINYSNLSILARVGYYIHIIYYLIISAFPVMKYCPPKCCKN